MRTFRSDNNAGVCPEALDAISEANQGHALGYGDDEWSERAVGQFRSLFGDCVEIFFVATGTAANTLAVASMTERWQRVLCYDQSHWNEDESTAPERVTSCRTIPIAPIDPKRNTKLMPEQLKHPGETVRGVHQPQPGALTISNPTEFGEVYTPEEVRALCETAHAMGFSVHVDGARFANAVATIVDRHKKSAADAARALTIDAGVDALSFGGTKNGLALGEAVIFFPQGDGARCARAAAVFPHHRKSTGHLLSKHRFVSAPFAAALESGAWLRHARHANDMATRVDDAIGSVGVSVNYSVDANVVFPVLAPETDALLRARGHQYYPFGPTAWNMVRLMCSWDTDADDIAALVRDLVQIASAPSTDA